MTAFECPSCKADLKGDPVQNPLQEIFGGTTHFSRVIGISDGDSVGFWKCPDCGHRWDRNGGCAEQARRNILKKETMP